MSSVLRHIRDQVCVLAVCVCVCNWGVGRLVRGEGGVWPFFKHSCVVMVASALMLPNLQLRGSYFGLLTLEKAMTSRLGDLLSSQGRLLGWDGLWGVMTGRAGHSGGTGGSGGCT